jgi:hypothetical protein
VNGPVTEPAPSSDSHCADSNLPESSSKLKGNASCVRSQNDRGSRGSREISSHAVGNTLVQ